MRDRLFQAEQTHHEILVRLGYYAVNTHTALALGGFFGEDVTFERLLVCDLTGAGYLETLLGTRVCFNLRHCLNAVCRDSLKARSTGSNLWSLFGKYPPFFVLAGRKNRKVY